MRLFWHIFPKQVIMTSSPPHPQMMSQHKRIKRHSSRFLPCLNGANKKRCGWGNKTNHSRFHQYEKHYRRVVIVTPWYGQRELNFIHKTHSKMLSLQVYQTIWTVVEQFLLELELHYTEWSRMFSFYNKRKPEEGNYLFTQDYRRIELTQKWPLTGFPGRHSAF